MFLPPVLKLLQQIQDDAIQDPPAGLGSRQVYRPLRKNVHPRAFLFRVVKSSGPPGSSAREILS